MQYNFEWTPIKAKANARKHKVSFERAAEVFLDPLALSIFDDAHSEKEDRWITLGKDKSDLLLVVIHTFNEAEKDQSIIRIISARKANRNERKQYEGESL
ncbi:MAG: BrnT family toxin [Acidobacteriota bacterium]